MTATTHSSKGSIASELTRFSDAMNLRELYISVGNHHEVDHPGCSPGIDQLLSVAHSLRGRPDRDPTSVVLAASGRNNKPHNEYCRDLGIQNIPLPRLLAHLPEFEEALSQSPRLSDLSYETIMRHHADVVHFGRYLASHDIAFDEAFRNTGILKSKMVRLILTPEKMEAAAVVDAAIAQFLLSVQGIKPGLVVLNDWPALLSTQTLSGDGVKPDIISNHCVVPKLSSILDQPAALQDYQLTVFETMARAAEVTVLHTEADADNLVEISDYLGIPLQSRASVFVRNMIPSCFIELDPSEPIEPHPLISQAVKQDKLLAVITERLDPIKMDPCMLNGLLRAINDAEGIPENMARLRRVRIAFIAIASSYTRDEDSGLYPLYSRYTNQVGRMINIVNAAYQRVTGTSEDFILVNRDSEGEICGMERDTLRTQIYPFSQIALQLGQEGLCLSVQESPLVRAFKETPYPVVQLVSRSVGVSEKLSIAGLRNAVIAEDSRNDGEVAGAFMNAVALAMRIGDKSEYLFRQRLIVDLREYFQGLGTSYFGGALELLNDRISERQWLRNER